MVAPTLADYEYQYLDTGFKMNSSPALPFLDVTKVSGLDLPDYDPAIDDIDSQDGGVVTALYSKARTIVVEGTLYANPSTIEVTMDTLISNFTPTNVDGPFYYKHPGVNQRYINAKAIGFKADTDTLRRTGMTTVVISLAAENPHKRIDNADLTLAVQATNYPVTNSGLVDTYPIITITGGTMSAITLTNNSLGQSLTLTRSFITSDIVVVDFRKKSVTVNGTQNSSVATGTWWGITKSTTQNLRFTYTGSAAPTSVVAKTYSGWM